LELEIREQLIKNEYVLHLCCAALIPPDNRSLSDPENQIKNNLMVWTLIKGSEIRRTVHKGTGYAYV